MVLRGEGMSFGDRQLLCTGNATALLAADIDHRMDVKEKMDDRQDRRTSRRSRLWYRPCRCLNRASSQRSGRLPPSIFTNVEEVLRVVRSLPLPITSIVVEDVQVDLARLTDPTLRGHAIKIRRAWMKTCVSPALCVTDIPASNAGSARFAWKRTILSFARTEGKTP